MLKHKIKCNITNITESVNINKKLNDLPINFIIFYRRC